MWIAWPHGQLTLLADFVYRKVQHQNGLGNLMFSFLKIPISIDQRVCGFFVLTHLEIISCHRFKSITDDHSLIAI